MDHDNLLPCGVGSDEYEQYGPSASTMATPNPEPTEPARPTGAELVHAVLLRASGGCFEALKLALQTIAMLFVGGIYVLAYVLNAIFKTVLFMKLPITAAIVGLLLASLTSFGFASIVSKTASVIRHSVHGVVHDLAAFDICTLPLLSFAFPPCHPIVVASVGRADFPALLAIQHRAFDELVAGSTTNSELVLNVKHAELAIRDLVVLVKASNLTTKEPLADSLSQFSVSAQHTGRGLQRLISKVHGTVDRAMAYNAYALHLLKASHGQLSARNHVDAAIVRSFKMSLAHFATSISSILVDAALVSASLDGLEEQLLTIHALCVQEAWDTAVIEGELLWQLWTLLGGNRRQLWDLANRATVLQSVQQYRALASAYVSATVQALTVIDADLMELREQLTTQAIHFDHIPVEVQIESLQQSLYRLKDSSTAREETGSKTVGRRLQVEKFLN